VVTIQGGKEQAGRQAIYQEFIDFMRVRVSVRLRSDHKEALSITHTLTHSQSMRVVLIPTKGEAQSLHRRGYLQQKLL
jgi:hypothetical protein